MCDGKSETSALKLVNEDRATGLIYDVKEQPRSTDISASRDFVQRRVYLSAQRAFRQLKNNRRPLGTFENFHL